MIVVFIVVGLILVASLLGIFFTSKCNKIDELLYKISLSEKNINEQLNSKEDLIKRIITIIERQLKLDIKEFNDVKNIKSTKPNNYDKDIILNYALDKIKMVVEDYNNLSNVKSLSGIMEDTNSIELKLKALRSYYNTYVAEYNQLIRRFPYSTIASFKKYKIKSFYDIKK